MLISQISEPNFLQNELNFPSGLQLDFSKLICTGHSFGAMTAISSAAKDERIKAVATLDPWFLPYSK